MRKLGTYLATARKRRKQPLRAWAARLEVSVPTLMKMEKGNAVVSIGVYATALWLVSRHEALADVADPKVEKAALETISPWLRNEVAERQQTMFEPVATYAPQDRLYLWWLGNEAEPTPVGKLALASGGRAVSLRYAPAWLHTGFALSKDLPLVNDLFVPTAKDRAPSAVDDARPDCWGERVIRKFEGTPRLSILKFLLFAGHDRYRALGVSQLSDNYQPWRHSPLPGLENLDEMA